jgi:hypothetical protein
MPTPTDCKLYNKTKKKVYKKYPKHSAYRSGILVKTYKKNFKKKYGTRKKSYSGEKTRKKGLSRWFKEEWKNQRGTIGYKYNSDVYRPTKRITKKTPTTFKELNKKQVKTARREKYRKGRVHRFKKGGKYPFPYNKVSLYNTYGENIAIAEPMQYIPPHEVTTEFDMETDEDEEPESEQIFRNFLSLSDTLVKECFETRASAIDEMSNLKRLKIRKRQLSLQLKNEDYTDFCNGIPDIDFLQDPELINNLDSHQLRMLIGGTTTLLDELLLEYINDRLDNRRQLTVDNLEAFIDSDYSDLTQVPSVDELTLTKIVCYCLIRSGIINIIINEFGWRLDDLSNEMMSESDIDTDYDEDL